MQAVRRQRKSVAEKPAGQETGPASVPGIVGEVLNTSGQSLDGSTRSFMESQFGHDFSKVRVHADRRAATAAASIDALAFTVGRDVVFGAQRYAPNEPAGRRLLAHELAHVVQQSDSSRSTADLELSRPDNSLELEADRAAELVMRMPAAVLRSSENEHRISLSRQKPGLHRKAVWVPPGNPLADINPAKLIGENLATVSDPYLGQTNFLLNGKSLTGISQPDAQQAFIGPGIKFGTVQQPSAPVSGSGSGSGAGSGSGSGAGAGSGSGAGSSAKPGTGSGSGSGSGSGAGSGSSAKPGTGSGSGSGSGAGAGSGSGSGSGAGSGSGSGAAPVRTLATCWFDSVSTNNGSNEVHVLQKNRWVAVAEKENLAKRFPKLKRKCAKGTGKVTLTVKGEAKDADLDARVRTHEDRHARDNEAIFNRLLVPWDTAVTNAQKAKTTQQAAAQTTCTTILYSTTAGSRPEALIATLRHDVNQAGIDFHNEAAGQKEPIHPEDVASDCGTATLRVG